MRITRPQKLFFSFIVILALFGWWDGRQIIPFHELKNDVAWNLYEQWVGPTFYITALVLFGLISYMMFLYTKDKGLMAGSFVALYIMFISGVEDVFFFLLGPHQTVACMDWFETSGHITWRVANALGAECVTPNILYGTAIGGIIIAYLVYNWIRLKY